MKNKSATSFLSNKTSTADAHLFGFIKKHLYVAAVCDILDELGYPNQAMHQRLRPLLPDMHNCGFLGRARTFRWMDTNHIADDPYGLEIEAMDSLKENFVLIGVGNCNTCSSLRNASHR